MMSARILSLLLAILGLTAAARAEPVRILVDKANPPFMYLTTENTAAGIYPAIIAEAFARMGRPVVLEALPWKRALAMMDQNQAGVAGIYKNEERLAKYDFSDSLFLERLLVIQRAGSTFSFTGLTSLKGMKIGVLRGWSYGDAFDAARKEGLFTVEEVDGDAQNLSKLQSGRIDAAIAVKEGADSALSASGARHEFLVHEQPLAENAAYLAFAKSAGRQELLAQFNEALASMRRDGTLEKVVLSIVK